MKELIHRLRETRKLQPDEYKQLLTSLTKEEQEYLFLNAREVAQEQFSNGIFIRGLIELTNYCKNDCYYCGIRRSNDKAQRYRLTKEEVLESCEEGYRLGFRTFVMQGGEDDSYTPKVMVDIIKSIREKYPDCAITLSLGEKDYDTYKQYYDAGANRYLLRHESINAEHYASLHPQGMTIQTRSECLFNLKKIGFQTGSGIMVGSPNQTIDNIVEDILFLEELQPQMIGIGPYLPYKDTPFKDKEKGSLELTLIVVAILRLMHPYALIPSTTALATIADDGRDKGILAGANVVMPNLSPIRFRKKYLLYNDKACMDDEAAESLASLQKRLEKIGYTISYDRGDFRK
jgi:biotin synthase